MVLRQTQRQASPRTDLIDKLKISWRDFEDRNLIAACIAHEKPMTVVAQEDCPLARQPRSGAGPASGNTADAGYLPVLCPLEN